MIERVLGQEKERREAELFQCDLDAARLAEVAQRLQPPARKFEDAARFGNAEQGEEQLAGGGLRGHALRAGGEPHGHDDPRAAVAEDRALD